MKYYVKQVDPAYQESPLDFIDWDDTLVLTGNRNYKKRTVPAFDLWRNNWADAAEHMAAWDARCTDHTFDEDDFDCWYDTIREIIEDFLPPQPTRGPYSEEEITRWKVILHDMNTCPISEAYRPTLDALNLITGGDWKLRTLHGCCQGDWQDCYYDSLQYDTTDIDLLEIAYFNLGTEWIVHDDDCDCDVEGPEDISGYSCYVYGCDYRKELAEIIGCDPTDLVIFKYAGEVRKAVYTLDE